MAMGTSTKGLFYTYPWQPFGNWKYLMFLTLATFAYNDHTDKGVPWKRNIGLHLLIISALRYLLFQLWGTATRLPTISRKYQIVKKGITFEQIDHEANWEHTLFVAVVLIMAGRWVFPKDLEEQLKPWDGKGLAIAFLLHMGPVEWIYYWAHRALHHHYLYTRYHSHHHSSFVTQPITSSNHPMLESLFYNVLFGIPIGVPYILGYGSFANIYIYVLFIDLMDAWGHCNFEFIPKRLFDIIPPLKYLIYSPTFHALHHTKVHTNFSLFMPLYDYIYNTTDPTTDELHHQIREGHEDKVDCVYLTHPTEVLSFFHLPFGFQTFAAQPFSKKWYIWAISPLSLPIMLLLWMFAKPFTVATHFVGKSFELQTWLIPRFKFQYNINFEKSRIQSWVENCILEAQDMGVKVIALGLLNKDQVSHEFLSNEAVNIPIVNGDTLTSTIIIKKIEALKENNIFLAQAHTRVGQAIAKYLCEHGTKVLAMFPSREQFKTLCGKIDANFKNNLMYATSYEDGRNSMVWVVGEEIGAQEQRWAPPKAIFHTFTVFPLPSCRRDCVYEPVPSLELPNNAKTINVCEDIMPRNVVRACYAAGMIHSQEGWKHNDFNDEISTYVIEKTWESTLKHGFTLPK